MEPLGVAVNIIERGNYDTDIDKNAAQRTGQQSSRTDRSKYKKPDHVAATVEQALSEPDPRRRYVIVPEQKEAEILIRKPIEQLVQLNEGHAFSYDRAALMDLLEDALNRSPANCWQLTRHRAIQADDCLFFDATAAAPVWRQSHGNGVPGGPGSPAGPPRPCAFFES